MVSTAVVSTVMANMARGKPTVIRTRMETNSSRSMLRCRSQALRSTSPKPRFPERLPSLSPSRTSPSPPRTSTPTPSTMRDTFTSTSMANESLDLPTLRSRSTSPMGSISSRSSSARTTTRRTALTGSRFALVSPSQVPATPPSQNRHQRRARQTPC